MSEPESSKQPEKRGNSGQFQTGQPSANPSGRPKGSKNKATLFKDAVFDGIVLAAKRYAEDQGKGDGSQAEYIAGMLADNNHRGRIITIGSNMVPKELHAEVKVDRVSIVMGPDDDCKEGER